MSAAKKVSIAIPQRTSFRTETPLNALAMLYVKATAKRPPRSAENCIITALMDEYGFRRATLTGTIPGNVFTINPGITVSISNLTLKNGSAVQGGAIYNNGNLSIANCTLTGNSVYQSDIYATYQYTYLYTFYRGGAIYNTGILSIADCTFTDNCASSSGGAIYNNGTLVSVSNCTFTNNTAVRGDGGAICNFGTITSVSGCSFTNNTAGDGGAICNGPVTNGFGIYSTLNATNCTFTGNTAATGWGGAILNGDAATLNLSKCSFTHNTAATGGSIYSWGPLTVNECTFMELSRKLKNNLYTRGETFLPSTQDIDLLEAFGERTYERCRGNPSRREDLGYLNDDSRKVSIPEESLSQIRQIMKLTGFMV